MRTSVTTLLLAGAIGAATAPASAASPDTTFMRLAAQGGMAEVAEATLAQTRGGPTGKAFALRMLADHGMANRKLAALAKAKSVTLPTDIGPANAKMKGTLESLHGTTFDTAYLQHQQQAHMETAALFRREIVSGKDPGVVAFAKAVLPAVEAHIALDRKDLATIGAKTAPGSGTSETTKQ